MTSFNLSPARAALLLAFLAVGLLTACESRYGGGYQTGGTYGSVAANAGGSSIEQEAYPAFEPNPLTLVAERPVSTISLDVDTAAYSRLRRAIREGQRPPPHALRIEEMVNYFDYDYPRAFSPEEPFAVTATLLPSPWQKHRLLLHVGIKAFEVPRDRRPPLNLVFLVDVSGSMAGHDRLPLVKQALLSLVRDLQPEDRVAIVTYAGSSEIALAPVDGDERYRIERAIGRLDAGGGTAGARGIQTAYRLAEDNFDSSAVNRVILFTDGDFNIGVSDSEDLIDLIGGKRDEGIYLSVLTVGSGNLNDQTAQALAQNGNGNAAYLDNILEADRVLSEQMGATFIPVADDVKAQIEFNPARVSAYRLLGYETRALRREDFNDDSVDAADIGSGHSVTLFYEITPNGVPAVVDPLRYQDLDPAVSEPRVAAEGLNAEFAFLKIRYKRPGAARSNWMSWDIDEGDKVRRLRDADSDTRFALAVAALGLRLREDRAMRHYGYEDIAALAAGARGQDPSGERAEFLRLVRQAEKLQQTAWNY